MKITLEWKPVLEPLHLRDYNPAYGDESISVCVNPPQEFMEERAEIIHEFSERYDEYSRTLLKKNDKDADVIREFSEWSESKFTPALHGWCARLFSYGDDKYSADDLAEFGRVDVHFLNWLMRRAVGMVDEHKSGRKKNSATR